MKYSINGYSQERLVKNELDLIDSLILRVLSDIYSSNSKKIDYKIIKNDKYMWISYGYLFEQIPIVGSERTLMRKIDKLIEKKMLKKELITSKKGVKGRYLYISFGENYLELTEYVQKEEKKPEKEERTKCQNDMNQMTNCHDPNDKMSSHQMTKCHDKDSSIIYSSINNKLKEKNKKEIYKSDDELPFQSKEFIETYNDFKEMRKKKKDPYTARAEVLILKRLEKFSNGNEKIAIEILERSIIGGWSGVFALKDNGNQNFYEPKIRSQKELQEEFDRL